MLSINSNQLVLATAAGYHVLCLLLLLDKNTNQFVLLLGINGNKFAYLLLLGISGNGFVQVTFTTMA